MANLSDAQRQGIEKLIEGLQELLDSQVFNLYGFDPEFEIENLKRIMHIMQEDQASLARELEAMQNIIKPDETDVHNINRRIELLAQKIAKLESDERGFWRKLGGN